MIFFAFFFFKKISCYKNKQYVSVSNTDYNAVGTHICTLPQGVALVVLGTPWPKAPPTSGEECQINMGVLVVEACSNTERWAAEIKIHHGLGFPKSSDGIWSGLNLELCCL